jgi:CheY-like chemotaxis protein
MTETFVTSPPTAPRMLIADDDPAIVHSLAERCTKMGFHVETATNGIHLLVKARQSQPDILIVDINMPELDGISVCMNLQDFARKRIDVVVVTGRSEPRTLKQCEDLNMRYIRKGPDFWTGIEAALTEIYPGMADKILALRLGFTGAEPHRRPRVLVVDDDPAMEAFFSDKLGQCGVDTLYASRALQGFHFACRKEPSAIIADYYMPDGDAQYLLYRLRGTPATENIPVIVISGKPLDALTEHSLRHEIGGRPGAAHILRKSFDTDELFGALQKFCSFEKRRAPH